MFFKSFLLGFISLTLTSGAFANTQELYEVSVMTYNVENLFDNKHDKGKSDWTYLPLKVKQASRSIQAECNSMSNDYYRRSCLEMDWNDKIMLTKINNIARVIRSYNYGHGPDILVLQEVENIKILRKLNRVGQLGFRSIVLIEGPDKRGIDVAIMSKFPLVEKARSHRVHLTSSLVETVATEDAPRPTRDILEATFQIGSKKLTVFANHWPSQANPDQHRATAAKTLAKLAAKVRGSAVIAAGDFNTLSDDAPHGLNNHVISKRDNGFIDVQVEAKKRHTGYHAQGGSHWYKGKWSYLDKILFMNKTTLMNYNEYCDYYLSCVRPVWSSFEILDHNYMLRDLDWTDRDTGDVTTYRNIPWRFDAKTGEGYADHLPVAIKFTI